MCLITFPFLRLVVIEFPKCWHQSTNRGESTCPCQFDWEQLPHSPYSPDLTSSDSNLFGSLKEFLCRTYFFEWWWSEELVEQMAKNPVQRFLCWRNKKKLFFWWENVFLRMELKNKAKIFPGGNVSCYIVKIHLIYWMTLAYIRWLLDCEYTMTTLSQ